MPPSPLGASSTQVSSGTPPPVGRTTLGSTRRKVAIVGGGLGVTVAVVLLMGSAIMWVRGAMHRFDLRAASAAPSESPIAAASSAPPTVEPVRPPDTSTVDAAAAQAPLVAASPPVATPTPEAPAEAVSSRASSSAAPRANPRFAGVVAESCRGRPSASSPGRRETLRGSLSTSRQREEVEQPSRPRFPKVKPVQPLRLACGALVCSLALLAPLASAQAPAASGAIEVPLANALQGDAKAAFDSANLLIANQDFAGAITKLSQAYSLSKDPRLLFNTAICEKNLHHYARMRGTWLTQYQRDSGASLTAGESRKRW